MFTLGLIVGGIVGIVVGGLAAYVYLGVTGKLK
jgi:tetrahydromethanopterin S-methyltransferase subunit F